MTEVYKDLKWFEMPSDKYKDKGFEIAQNASHLPATGWAIFSTRSSAPATVRCRQPS